MSAQPAIVFDGPLEDLTKKQVDPICIALNLPYKNKKKDGLVKLIKTTLFSISPELEQDPRFSKLYKYGRDTPTEQQPKKGKKSVAKAKEDLVEAGKPQKPLTGYTVFYLPYLMYLTSFLEPTLPFTNKSPLPTRLPVLRLWAYREIAKVRTSI
jgi:hypothetical protein